ncbi:phospholipase D/nuclease [Trametes versicolor FP-101664 SS1]|uniref:phospholipase D/nuclease n=1 Tax=Trametes versicolor (strain FP-101664) TaxID=717944 RepID=UPI0004623A53|nr:phospholipase D/nuclease [Trametes versicolor FP-101664 SS1]EIW56343.1 phospholipase D/nuclease [Trametes versicolor FP-101664 SS1]
MDDDIARAIALSLQESNGRAAEVHHEVIDLSADDEDDEDARFEAELQRAIEASKQETRATSAMIPQHTMPSGNPPTPSSSTPSFLSERAKLEQERVARQKRLRPDIDPGVGRAADGSDDEMDGGQRPRDAKRQRVSSSSRVGARRANVSASVPFSTPAPATASRSVGQGAASSSGAASRNLYFDGELRQTANQHVDPQKDRRPVFRLSEILAPKEDIEFAIVSAFCWSYQWMYQLFSPNTPVIAVDHDPRGNATIKAILPNWIRTTPFLRNGFGCMHMKFMLLLYRDGRLRVVVSTANLVEYDWRDIENSVWVQDIPKRPSPVTQPADTEDFASAMVRVLHALNVAPALINMLRNDHPNLPLQRLEDLRSHWDFSRVKAALVPSVAGKHEGWPKVILTGHTRLMKALLDMEATVPKDKELALECQGSSIGNYSSMWVNEFFLSARGESTQSWLETPKTRRAKVPYPAVKILFPTAQYVRESVLGESGGGTMFCRRKQWEGANFPRQLFHQTRSKRGRVLMHSKMILGTFKEKTGTLDGHQRASATRSSEVDTDEDAGSAKLAGWVYVGSHNFTPSAWGTLSGSGFNPSLNINNYELGVVIPLHTQEEVDKVACWERPPQKYVSGRDEPWMQTESPYFVEDG